MMNGRMPYSDPAWDRILIAAQKNLPEDIRDMVESQGVPVTHSNAVGQTALHIAALWGHIEALDVLIEYGADCNAANRMTGATPLHCLVQCASKGTPDSKLACIQALLQGGANPGKQDMSGRIPLDYIVMDDGPHFMGDWLECLTPEKPPIFKSRNATEIQSLLEQDETLVHAKHLGKTALTYICDELAGDDDDNAEHNIDKDGTMATSIDDNIEALKVLLDHGAKPDGSSINDEISTKHEECANNSNNAGITTPLKQLCLALKDAFNSSSNDIEGHRHRMEALEKAAILLRKHGAELNDAQILLDAGRRGLQQFVSFLIEKLNMSPNVQGRQGMTVLHFAARSGKVDMVRYLLSHPTIDISIKDDRGKTALDAAKANDKQDIISMLEQHSPTSA